MLNGGAEPLRVGITATTRLRFLRVRVYIVLKEAAQGQDAPTEPRKGCDLELSGQRPKKRETEKKVADNRCLLVRASQGSSVAHRMA